MAGLPYSNLQLRHWNPGASAPLVLPVLVVCNTPDEVVHENIRINSARDNEWLYNQPAHDRVAIICGSGPGLGDDLDAVRALAASGGDVIALNGAASYLSGQGIVSDIQVILDPQERTAELIGPAKRHLFASQVHPTCFERVPEAVLWHLQLANIDELLPSTHRERDYTLIGAASSVGTTALVVAFTLGYRTMHVFGCDSSHRAGQSHVMHQAMNDGEPIASVAFNGKHYLTSLTMKLQAERFPFIARLLQREGCEIHVHGSGLLPDIWHTPVEQMTEQEKYERMWSFPEYREKSPGAEAALVFAEIAKPNRGASVLDFGCGTGRASLVMAEMGLSPILVDFASNCRDPFAMHLPFIQHDLTEPLRLRAEYGFCSDVMEHIPAESMEATLATIFASAPRVFFQVGTTYDTCGALINQTLHVNILDHAHLRAALEAHGEIEFEQDNETNSMFYVTRKSP